MVTSSSATQGKTHWAIAIGIGQYPLLPPLPEAQANAVTVAAAWQAQTDDQYRSLVLSDQSLPLMGRPTYPNRENLEYWLDYATTELVQPGDSFWCFFSGYGVSYRDRDYLLPIEASLDRVATAGVPLRRVCEYLKLAGDRVGAAGRILLVLDVSRPPQDTLPPVGGEIPLLAQEMGVSIVVAEPGAGRQSSGLLAPALATALGQAQGMNLYALSRFVRETTRTLAQQNGRVAPQIQVFAHPHERLYETVVGRSRPEAPPPIESFVVFPASPPELEPDAAPEAVAELGDETAVFVNDQVTSPVLDAEALDRFASAATLPDAWATEPSAFEELFAQDWVPESSNGNHGSETTPDPAGPIGDQPVDRPVKLPTTPPAATVSPALPPIGLPSEPIPESQRDLATAAPIATVPTVSPGDDLFARQLVGALGFVGIALLAGVVARNYAALFGSGVDAPAPTVATPLPAPSNGATPPTGTLVPPPVQPSPAASPSPTPTPAKPAPSSPAAPTTNGTTAQLVQSAKAAMAVGQFQQALNLLAKVPANAQTPEIQQLRSQAVQGRDRNLLGLARVPIGTNQASEFGKAILRARQIKAGDPGYEQAQQAIDRWSRVILDLAKGRAQNGDFGGAIAAAKLVAADQGEVYTEAKSAIGQWQTLQQQQANNRATLQKAASQIKTGQASTYNRAIDLARAVPPTQPGYTAARDQIDLWSQEILKIAQTRASSNQLPAAIQTASLVPPNTAAYAKAQQAIAQWKQRVSRR